LIGARTKSKWIAAIWIATAMLPVLILTWYLGNLLTACDGAPAYFQHMAADFQVQLLPIRTLCFNGRENLFFASIFLWGVSGNVDQIFTVLIVVLPSVILNLVLAIRLMRGRIFEIVLSVVVVLSPISSLLVAVDTVRFVSLIQLTSLLVLVSVVRRLGVPGDGLFPAVRWTTPIVIMLAGLELGSSINLNDGQPMLKFPFEPLIQRTIMVAHGSEPFMVIPAQ
jgi:hypothetical protein